MSRSTPGPWNVEAIRVLLRYRRKNSGPWDWNESSDDDGNMPTDDDAELVAAAPALLEALEMMLQAFSDHATRLSAATVNHARAVVAEAKGEHRFVGEDYEARP